MLSIEHLTPVERARQLRNPDGETGVAVAEYLNANNRQRNARTVAFLDRSQDIASWKSALAFDPPVGPELPIEAARSLPALRDFSPPFEYTEERLRGFRSGSSRGSVCAFAGEASRLLR